MVNVRWRFSPERLREVRTARGWSRPALAMRMGIRAEAIKNWEIGKNQVQMANFLDLVYALGCEPADLFEKCET